MELREIMTADVCIIAPTATIGAAARMMRERNIGMLPVGENDRLVGSITDRDIAIKGAADDRNPEATSVREVMSERIVYGFEDQSVEEGARLMGENRIRRLPVLDRDKRMVGIVSLGDIAERCANPTPAGETLAAVSRG
jgi:CBS domain-containing protein